MQNETPTISTPQLGAKRSQTILSNGMKLLHFERKGMPIYMRVAVIGGSRFDPKDSDGTSHFLEHMLVAGSKKFPTKDKLATHIEQLGGSLGAWTGPEFMSINTCVADKSDLDEGFMILNEMLLQPLFKPETVEKERGAIQSELRDATSNPAQMLWEIYRRLFYQGTSLGRSNLGTRETIDRISRDSIIDYYRKIFVGSRSALIMSGDVTMTEAVEKAEQYLKLPTGKVYSISTPLPINREENIAVEPFIGKDQVHIFFGFRTPERGNVDNDTLRVIAEVLGGGRASSLSRLLRLERGLVYDVSAFNIELSDAGAWIIKTSTSKEKVNEVIEIVINELRRVKEEGLSPEEILFAQNKMIKSLRMQLQSSDQWVNWHTGDALLGNNEDAILTFGRNISNVNSQQTQTVAQKFFGENQWYLAACGDIKADQFIVRM